MTNPTSPRTPEEELKVRGRRSFLALGTAAVAGIAGWEILRSQPQMDSLGAPFRKVLDFNGNLTKSALFSPDHLAPEFPMSRIQEIRANGEEGLADNLDPKNWKLSVKPYSGPARELDMDAIRKLPKVTQTTEFKCIEGWSAIVNWSGVRLADFTREYAAGSEKAGYVGMETPDEGYFVGIDMASALHPQTILAYERNGQPLEEEHGAPLRLVIPVKYGIKNIKRIGTIAYADERPRDYWHQEGYDYYAGL